MEFFAPFGGHFDLSEPLQQDEPMYELSLEDPEFECFALFGGNIDCCRLLEPTREVVEPSLGDIELESFAQLGDEQYFDEVHPFSIPCLSYSWSMGKPWRYLSLHDALPILFRSVWRKHRLL